MIYRFGTFRLDDERFELWRGDEQVPVEGRVFDLILHLVRNRTRVVPRSELQQLLWPDVTVDAQHGLDQAIYTARKVLGTDVDGSSHIATVRGRGFRFICQTTEFASYSRQEPLPFVGRKEALAAFDHQLSGLDDGRGGVVVVGGEPGIGKTRLLYEFRQLTHNRKHATAIGRCVAEASAPDYWPWIEILRGVQHLLRIPSSLLDGSLSPVATWLGFHVGAQKHHGSEEIGQSKFRLLDWMAQLLLDSAKNEPLVLFLDDLQWADRSSLAFIPHLAPQLVDSPILLVCAVRQPVVGHSRNLLEVNEALSSLQRSPGTIGIDLKGLSEPEVRELLKPTVEEAGLVEAAARLFARTGGNPLFVQQLLPTIGRNDEGSLPETVVGAVKATLGQLPASTAEALAIASVFFGPVSVQSGAALSEQDWDSFAAACQPAVDRGLLSQCSRQSFEFSHAILREVIYAQIPVGKRAVLHERAAQLIESAQSLTREHLRHVACHRVAAVPLCAHEKAIESSSRAAEAAISIGAFEEAAAHYSDCVELCNDAGDRGEFLLKLGEALVRSGRRDEGRASIRRALDEDELSDRVDLAEVALRLAPGFFAIELGAQDEFVEDLLRSALEQDPSLAADRRALLMARLAMAVYWDCRQDEQRSSLIRHAKRLRSQASGSVSDWTESYLLAAAWHPDSLNERIAVSSRLSRSSQADPECRLMNYVFLACSLIESGLVKDAEAECRRFESAAANSDVRPARWYVPLFRALFAIEHAELSEATQLVEEIAAGIGAGDRNAAVAVGTVRAMCEFHREPTRELAAVIASLAGRYPMVNAWETALALVLYRSGALEEALEIYRRQIENVHVLRRDLTWLVSIVQLAELCADLGDARGAKAILSILEPYRGRRVLAAYGVVTWGSVDRVLGRLLGCLGRTEKAKLQLSKAIRDDRLAQSWIWLSYSYANLAELFEADGESERAVEAACRSGALAERAGQIWVLRRLSSLRCGEEALDNARRVGGTQGDAIGGNA